MTGDSLHAIETAPPRLIRQESDAAQNTSFDSEACMLPSQHQSESLHNQVTTLLGLIHAVCIAFKLPVGPAYTPMISQNNQCKLVQVQVV